MQPLLDAHEAQIMHFQDSQLRQTCSKVGWSLVLLLFVHVSGTPARTATSTVIAGDLAVDFKPAFRGNNRL